MLPLNLPDCQWATFEYTVNVIDPDVDLWVNVWLDWNRDGDWDDAGEQIFTDQAIDDGINNLQIQVPADASAGVTYARFRLCSLTGLEPTGSATSGEVEDYKVIGEPGTTKWTRRLNYRV